MKLFGYEMRRIPPEEDYTIDKSYPVMGIGGMAYRIRPKPGYRMYQWKKGHANSPVDEVVVIIEKEAS